MFQKSCLVPPLTPNSDGLLQLTWKAGGMLLFGDLLSALGVLCWRMSLVFFAFVFFRLLSSLSVQNPLIFLHTDNYGLLVWMHRAWMGVCSLVAVSWLEIQTGWWRWHSLSLLTDLKFGISLGSNAFAVFISFQSLVIPGASVHPPAISDVDAPEIPGNWPQNSSLSKDLTP